MTQADYYSIMGLTKGATQDDIKKAYRKLARKYHPDVSKDDDAGEKMAKLNEANDVLSDPDKRKAYDQVGHQAWAQGARSADDMRPPPGWQSAQGGHYGDQADFSDLFRDMFNERGSRGGPRGWPGQDTHATITISLHEAYHGTSRQIQLQGHVPDGQGRLIPELRTLDVKVPAGVAQDQMIRLAGQGEPGMGAPAGDLYLKVDIQTGDRTRVEGRNVHMPLVVTPWEAALGAQVPVHTPLGTLHVTVPAGSVARRKLRLKGKGIPGRQAGDLMLEIDIAIPGAITPEQKAAWEALATAYPGFDPRPKS